MSRLVTIGYDKLYQSISDRLCNAFIQQCMLKEVPAISIVFASATYNEISRYFYWVLFTMCLLYVENTSEVIK